MSMYSRKAICLAPILLLAGCGQDPAPAASPVAPVAAPRAPGLAISEDPSRVKADANGAAKCNIETLDGKLMEGAKPQVPASANTALVGWYADVDGKTPGADLKLVIHDQDQKRHWVVPVAKRTARPDVDAALGGGGAFEQSGFSMEADFSKLPAGWYGVYLEGTAGVCGLGRIFGIE